MSSEDGNRSAHRARATVTDVWLAGEGMLMLMCLVIATIGGGRYLPV